MPKTAPFKKGFTLAFMCCFCGEEIARPEPSDPMPAPTPTLACGIWVTGNYFATEEEQVSQQYWCHAQCLISRMHPMASADTHFTEAPES